MFHALALAALLTASEVTRPDEESDATLVLTGSVSGPEQSRLADVVVSITGPSMNGEVVVVTNELGEFRAPLPAGVFTLRFEKEGFRPFVRTGWEVSRGKGARIAIELLPDAGDGVVVIGCCLMLVDIGSAREGGTGSLSSFAQVPLAPPFEPGGVSRSFDTLVWPFPGIRTGAGGTRNGADPARELDARLDGVSVRDPVLGLLAVPLTSALVDESAIVTAAPDATEGGSTSGWLGASMLSGGNELHGRVFSTVTPAPLGSASRTVGDLGAGLGGPVVKDRLWFAAGGQWPWASPTLLDPGAQGLLRLTALLSSDARLEARYLDTGARLLDHAVRSRVATVSGSFAAFDKRLLLDVRGWWMGVSDRSGTSARDLSSQSAGGNGTLTVLMTAWGHHLLRVGVEGRSSHARSSGRDVFSTFVDENWSVADRVTLLLGARTDLQRLSSGASGATLSGGLLPRLGAVFDPTQQGRAKIFGWWGRLEDDVPLALLDGARQPVAFGSGLRPATAASWSLGTQFELWPFVAGLRYTERRLIAALGRIESGDRTTLVNPGQASSPAGAAPTRLQRSLTISVSRPMVERWVLEASGRLEWLEANVLANALLDTPASGVGASRQAWLPELKGTAGRSFPLGPHWQLELGASVALQRAIPEAELFDPGASDLAWTGRVDVRVGLGWTDGRQGSATLSVEGFDLLDTAGPGPSGISGRSVRVGVAVTF
jgi:hypothetical protein